MGYFIFVEDGKEKYFWEKCQFVKDEEATLKLGFPALYDV
tara:strand:- start:53 stop:172 length:120 start_codon:yes stop_codon:yes gene_type:complete